MSERNPMVMLDTNIWLDYELGREPGCSQAVSLIGRVLEHDGVLYTTASALKDIFYIIQASLKRGFRESGEALDSSRAASCETVAWACIRQIIDLAQIVRLGSTECLQAFVLREIHGDFEDNLMLAAAQECHLDWFVTQDRKMQGKGAIPCIAPEALLAVLDT